MRRLEVTFRPEAIADLQDIYRFIAEISQSHVTAERYTERIMARALRIGDAPNGGRPRDDLEPGLRIVPFESSAVIVYRVGATVDIANIFYGGRDYEALYRGHKPDWTRMEMSNSPAAKCLKSRFRCYQQRRHRGRPGTERISARLQVKRNFSFFKGFHQ